MFYKIVSHKKNKVAAYRTIKDGLNYSDLCDAADYIDAQFNEEQKNAMFGTALPSSYKDLGKSSPVISAKNLINEINWALVSIRKHAYEVSLFLNYKNEFEKYLLLGDLKKAESYLDKIDSEICYSMWGLENRFLLKEHIEDTSSNKEYLSFFNSINQGEGITKSLAHFLSIRAEKDLSINRFNYSLANALNGLSGNFAGENKEYYLFKLSFLNNIDFTEYISILSYDSNNSILDRYLTLRKVLIYLFTVATAQQKEDVIIREAVKYFKSRINYLFKKTGDQTLLNLKLINDGEIEESIKINTNKPFATSLIGLVDQYTSGLYNEVELECSNLLKSAPLYFDLYILYIKSLVYQGKDFIPIGTDSSFQNQILKEMHKVSSVSKSIKASAQNLLRIANNLSSNVLGYGIVDYVLHQTSGQTERKLMSKVSYFPLNPILYECFEDQSTSKNFLEQLNKIFPSSLTIAFLKAKQIGGSELDRFKTLIPEVQYRTEIAKQLQHEKKYSEAIIIWETIIQKHAQIIPMLETAIRNLYFCYEQEKRYDDCINLYVDSFFSNAFIIDKISTNEIITIIKKNRFKNISPTINLPIFYTIADADENEIHIAFERFNVSNNVTRPSSHLTRIQDYHNEKIIFFLKHTCSQEILKHSIHINGSKERLEERLEICRFLLTLDITDKSFYEDEIKYISNILIIQKGLLELDESKIYVNEQGILSTELKDYNAIYSRFQAIAKLTEKNKKVVFLDIDTGALATVNLSENGEEKEKTVYSENPLFDIYKELFNAIMDKFLNSKFGIVAYLSTRIRHGVLLGEIRPFFEKHKLITQKEGSTLEYRTNHYWEEKFKYENPEHKAELQKLLKQFSYEVDGLIFDLIKKYLQLKDEIKNPDGWFDYKFENADLYLYSVRASKFKDFNQFVKDAFEILWHRTDENLTLIRNKIETDIAKSFNELFDRLEKNVTAIPMYSSNQEILTEIKSCSTDIQTVIKKVSNWFKRSGTQTSDFKINTLIDIIMEHINKSYPNKSILLTREGEFEDLIKGEYYTHFADLIRIFLENILKHSDEHANEIASTISLETKEDILHVQISNVITNQHAVDELKHTFIKDTKIQIDKLLSENKSGYHKAMKILSYDLKNDFNRLYSSCEEQCFKAGMFINFKELIV